MEIAIDVPETIIEHISDGSFGSRPDDVYTLALAAFNGIPLPKEHGRLSDVDELVKKVVKEYGVNSIHELPLYIKMFYDKFINSAPTILDATFDYKLKNYAFGKEEENGASD